MDTQLTADDAVHALDGRPLVSSVSGALSYIKEMRDKCLAAGIPSIAAAPTPSRG